MGSYYFATGDVNAEGKTDIVTINQDTDNISILAGNGNGTFQTATFITVGDQLQHRIVDINGDQKDDILVSDGNGVSILLNGKLSARGPTVTLDTTDPAAPVISLTDDDGASSTDKITTNGGITLTGVEIGGNSSVLDRWWHELDQQFHGHDWCAKQPARPADGCGRKYRPRLGGLYLHAQPRADRRGAGDTSAKFSNHNRCQRDSRSPNHGDR